MARVSEDTIANRILEIAQSLDYVATIEPEREPFRLFGWFRARQFRPDIRVNNGSRSAIVVVKSRPIMVYDVFLTDQVRGEKGTQALMCVPDTIFPQIRESARQYAEELDVRLCSLSDAGQELQALLN